MMVHFPCLKAEGCVGSFIHSIMSPSMGVVDFSIKLDARGPEGDDCW